MITSDGWFDWAIRRPGPPVKVNAGISPVQGIFLHSAEGYEGGLWPVLDRAVVDNKSVSWHLSNMLDGRLFQHYPVTARCWHATAANNSYVGMEHEGKIPENPSLTEAQIATAVRVIRELADTHGWTPRRSPVPTEQTLWEHNEVTRLGGTGTDCPSGRIPWDEILVRLQGGSGGQVDVSGGEPTGVDETYRVKRGDTLFALARSWGVSVDQIVALNAIADADSIQEGQMLRRPR